MTAPDGPVVCIGEAMVLVSPAGAEPLATASTFELTMAGAEANVARYLADLGTEASWLSSVGDDPLGERILSGLTSVGVHTQGVARSADHPTGVFFKDPEPTGSRVFYYRSGSAFSRLTVEDIVGWPLEQAPWVHLSGITPALSAGCREVTEAVLRRCRAGGVPVSFDVNYRPSLWSGRSAGAELLHFARQADVVFVGLDEAQDLWGSDTAAQVADELPGPGLVVIKDADRSASEFATGLAGTVVTEVEARKVSGIVDPVGAGDAFAAGYLSQLFRGAPPEGRLQMGHSVAAWTLATAHDFRPGHGPAVRPSTER